MDCRAVSVRPDKAGVGGRFGFVKCILVVSEGELNEECVLLREVVWRGQLVVLRKVDLLDIATNPSSANMVIPPMFFLTFGPRQGRDLWRYN